MILLIDTHIAVWLVDRPDLLKAAEKRAIEASDFVLASTVSLWELRLKWDNISSDGRRKGPIDPRDVRDGLLTIGVSIVSLTPEDTLAPLAVGIPHKDPFDLLLLVQAQERGAKLLTRDRLLVDHPLALRFE